MSKLTGCERGGHMAGQSGDAPEPDLGRPGTQPWRRAPRRTATRPIASPVAVGLLAPDLSGARFGGQETETILPHLGDPHQLTVYVKLRLIFAASVEADGRRPTSHH